MTQKHCNKKDMKIIQINEEEVKEDLGEIVRGTVQDTLNGLLEEEVDRLCNARRYERTEGRKDTRAGHYSRALHTKAGEVELKVPKLRVLPFGNQESIKQCFKIPWRDDFDASEIFHCQQFSILCYKIGSLCRESAGENIVVIRIPADVRNFDAVFNDMLDGLADNLYSRMNK